MGRQPCCDKVGLKRGPWTAEEDKKLMTFILTNGHCCWRAVPKLAGLLRCGKSCRLRWTNYLRPDLKRGLLSDSEEQLVIDLHSKIGNRWSKIAAHLPGRTDNEIKNHWNTHIKKKLKKMGIDPVTHKLISPISAGENQQQQQQQQEQEVVVADQEYGKKEEIWRNEDNISFHEDQEEEGTAGGEESNFFSRRDGDRPCPIMPRNDAFFCTDEVPLMQPEEIAVLPTSTAATPPPLISSSFSSSTCSTTSTTPSQLWDPVEELMSDFPTEVEVHWLESCLWGVMDDLGTTGSDLTCNANDIFGAQRSSSPSDPFALFTTRGDPISDKDYCSWKVPHF